WVSQFPAIGHWLGTTIGQMPDDFETAESNWGIVSSFGEPPPLLPELFTIGRENAIERLNRLVVLNTAAQLRLETRFPRHTKDFVSAFIAKLPEERRVEYQSRVIILDKKETFKEACSLNESHVLVADFDVGADSGPQLVQRALQRRHAVIYSSSPGGIPHGNSCELASPETHDMN